MKVHQLTRAFWEQQQQQHYETSLSLGCKRLRPLAPKLAHGDAVSAALDLKSFIKPESGPRNAAAPGSIDERRDLSQVETQAGGTRWNPTQDQIRILEMLYRGGMRTPNAQQIEQITAQLGNYGKIEGKNVFYWFQNHKARERQRQKRNCLSLSSSPRGGGGGGAVASIASPTSSAANFDAEFGKEEDSFCKRKCRSWGIQTVEEEARLPRGFAFIGGEEDQQEEGEVCRTLELFPLHPEGRLII